MINKKQTSKTTTTLTQQTAVTSTHKANHKAHQSITPKPKTKSKQNPNN